MIIYKIVNLTTQKVYIGISSDFKSRVKRHKRGLKRNCHHNIELQRLWNKYGENDFDFIVVGVCKDRQEAMEVEKELIKTLTCLNETKGGDGGDTISKHPDRETIIKKSLKTRLKKGISYGEGFIKQQKKPFPKGIWRDFQCSKCKKVVKGKSNYLRYHEDNCGKKRDNDLIKCPHCGKIGMKGGMVRWHFDNCKIVNKNKRTKYTGRAKNITL